MVAGFLVFLIALPLCLGISMASGFPPTAGIVTAIVGGVLVSRLNGSHVTVNGPAAGLIVVVLAAVQSLGGSDAMAGYRYTLAAIVMASVLQMALGLLKAGRLASFFPASVVHGMLAAIGIIIMAKQIHVLVGVKPEANDLIETILAVPSSLLDPNPEVAAIGLSGLGILIGWSFLKSTWLRKVPAPLIVVLTGMAMGQYFDLDHEHVYLFLPDDPILPHHEFTVGPKFLVAIPDNFLASFYFPDFGKFATPEFWSAAISICLVGSLESLLAATAVDKLDPARRYSDLNRDLAAVGFGNVICGLIGGLPMIAEIVRSSANISNGAKTGWANFFHGGFMLLFVALFPALIHEIPLASLASLLVFTGFHLASPREFAKTMEIGKEQLALFMVTILGVLATDLLVGVALGIAAKFVLHILRGVNWKNLFQLAYRVEQKDPDHYTVTVEGAAVFSNFLALKSETARLPEGKKITIDLSDADLVDHTVMEFLHQYCHDYKSRGGQCKIHGLHNHDAVSFHPLAARRRKAFQRGKARSWLR